MKSVLISIQPKWCELIANGKKTIEARKTRPKIETPFKCYIYMTKTGNKPIKIIEGKNGIACLEIDYKMAGKVIGELVCDLIEKYQYSDSNYGGIDMDCQALEDTCLTKEEAEQYAKCNPLYGWHISNLKIYDKPKEPGEFKKPCEAEFAIDYCCGCPYDKKRRENGGDCNRQITRPPQSYCFVEEL